MAEEKKTGGQKPLGNVPSSRQSSVVAGTDLAPGMAPRPSVSGRPSISGRPSVSGRPSTGGFASSQRPSVSSANRASVSGPPGLPPPRPRSSSTVSRIREVPSPPPPGDLGTVATRLPEERPRESISKRLSLPAKRQTRGSVVCESPVAEDMQGLNCIGYSVDGSHLACGYGSGCIQIRRAENAALKQTVRSGLGSRVPMMYVRFHPRKGGRFFMASSCGRVYCGSVASGDYTVFSQEEGNEVNALDLTSDGERIVTGGRDTRVRVYDLSTGKVLQVYENRQVDTTTEMTKRAHSDRVYAVRCDKHREHMVITGGWDDNIKVWDIREPKFCVATMNGPHICGDAIDIEDDLLVTGSWTVDNSLQTWDLRQMKRIETIQPINRKRTNKGDFLYVAKFLTGDATHDLVFVGGSGLTELELISLSRKEVMCAWTAAGVVNCADSYKNYICFGGGGNVLRICQYTP